MKGNIELNRFFPTPTIIIEITKKTKNVVMNAHFMSV